MVDSDTVTYGGKAYDRAGNEKFWKVLDFLRQNPDARTLSVRKLADTTGVSKSLVSTAKKYFEEGRDAPPNLLLVFIRFAKREICAAHEVVHPSIQIGLIHIKQKR